MSYIRRQLSRKLPLVTLANHPPFPFVRRLWPSYKSSLIQFISVHFAGTYIPEKREKDRERERERERERALARLHRRRTVNYRIVSTAAATPCFLHGEVSKGKKDDSYIIRGTMQRSLYTYELHLTILHSLGIYAPSSPSIVTCARRESLRVALYER